MSNPTHHSRRRTLPAALVILLVGGLGTAFHFWAPSTPNAQSLPNPAPPSIAATPAPTIGGGPALPALASLSEELGDLTQRAMESVVSIAVQVPVSQGGGLVPFGFGLPNGGAQERFARGQGSGVIVTADGLVLTNNHVVADATEVVVTLTDGSLHDAVVVGTDPGTDLAVVRLDDPPASLTPLSFGDSDAVRPGELCMAIGNPFGLSGSASLGIVSATGRDRMGITDYENFIQTDAAVNPGNSGGALVDMSGRLIGINTAIFSRSGGSQGIGFAIPSNMARRIMGDLIEHGSIHRGWLGVGIGDVPDKVAEAFGIERGVLVASVEAGGPAAAAGLLRGDVVVAVDGTPMSDVDELRYRVADLGPGHTADLEIARRGGTTHVRVELGERPATSRPRH